LFINLLVCFLKKNCLDCHHKCEGLLFQFLQNIAEGHGRNSNKDLIRFLYISLGSASELETQLILSNKLGFLNELSFNELNDLNNEVIKMLVSLIRSKNEVKSETQIGNNNDIKLINN